MGLDNVKRLDFVLVFVVGISFLYPNWRGLLWILGLGYCMDLLSGNIMGIHTLSKGLCFWLVRGLLGVFSLDETILKGCVVLLCFLVDFFIINILGRWMLVGVVYLPVKMLAIQGFFLFLFSVFVFKVLEFLRCFDVFRS